MWTKYNFFRRCKFFSFISETPLESLFTISIIQSAQCKHRDFAENWKKLNIQLKIVKNLVECLKTKACLNQSSKLSYCTNQSIFNVKIRVDTESRNTV